MMGWLAPRLKHRIQIRKAVQTEDDDSYGSFDVSYETLLTVWGGVQPVKGLGEYLELIRGETVADSPTHEFLIRWSSVGFTLGKEFSSAFAMGFDSIADLSLLKSNFFIFLEEGSSVKGRLFRITGIKRDDDRREYVKFRAREIEELGTGAPE